jgi:hypothetical protein
VPAARAARLARYQGDRVVGGGAAGEHEGRRDRRAVEGDGAPAGGAPRRGHQRLARPRGGIDEEQDGLVAGAGGQEQVAGDGEGGQRADPAADAHAVTVAVDDERAADVAAGGGEAARGERREQGSLRLGAAPAAGGERGLDVGLEQRRQRRAAAGELDAAQRPREVAVVVVEQAAGVGRHGVEEEAELAARLGQPRRWGAGAVGVGGPRSELALGEAPDRLDDQRLVPVEAEVHGAARIIQAAAPRPASSSHLPAARPTCARLLVSRRAGAHRRDIRDARRASRPRAEGLPQVPSSRCVPKVSGWVTSPRDPASGSCGLRPDRLVFRPTLGGVAQR